MNEDFYIRLIYKKLNNQLTSDESAQLDAWLSHSEDNRQLATEIKEVYELSGGYFEEQINEVEVDAAWHQQLKVIEESGAKVVAINTASKRRGRIITFASAAAILLCLAIGLQFLAPASVNMIELTATTDKEKIDLPDGSIAYLKKGTTLIYPEQFSKKIRSVQLVGGEGVFEVVKNKGQFEVSTFLSKVEVLGTIFTVSESINETKVTVLEGEVKFSMKDGEALNLIANEQAIGNATDKTIAKAEKIDNSTAWFSNTLVFEDKALGEVIKDLAIHYDRYIAIENKMLATCPFSSTFKNKDLDYILNTIDAVFGSTSAMVGEEVVIKGGNCE